MIETLKKVSERECFQECEKIVVEFPAAFYNPKFSSSAITPLAAVSGACMAMFQNKNFSKIVPVYPVAWNGGKKKEKIAIIIEDLIGHHSEWEFDDKPKREADFEHVIDAIGMAYWLSEREYFDGCKTDSLCTLTKMKSGLN